MNIEKIQIHIRSWDTEICFTLCLICKPDLCSNSIVSMVPYSKYKCFNNMSKICIYLRLWLSTHYRYFLHIKLAFLRIFNHKFKTTWEKCLKFWICIKKNIANINPPQICRLQFTFLLNITFIVHNLYHSFFN